MKIIQLSLCLILLPVLAQGSDLSIFAASSLTEGLRAVARTYQERHPDHRIQLHFAGSQALATQIEQGAPADLLITADTRVMNRLQQVGLVEPPRLLLHNRLVLATDPALRPQLLSIRDLGRPSLLLAVGNDQVPIGAYTRQLLESMTHDPTYGAALSDKIAANIVSKEHKVKAIVAKLLLGEVDAGIVYQSDLVTKGARSLNAVELPQQHNPRADYPVARLKRGQPESEHFMAFLFGAEAQQLFARQGFQPGAEQ